mgnify:CR=1 FL=1
MAQDARSMPESPFEGISPSEIKGMSEETWRSKMVDSTNGLYAIIGEMYFQIRCTRDDIANIGPKSEKALGEHKEECTDERVEREGAAATELGKSKDKEARYQYALVIAVGIITFLAGVLMK